jgi:hypothetical protein
MNLQPREPLLANEEVLFEICELGAATRIRPTVDVQRSHKLPSRLHNPSSKSRHLGLRICDHKTRDFSDERDPPFIGLSVTVQRAKAEPAEANHTPS